MIHCFTHLNNTNKDYGIQYISKQMVNVFSLQCI